MGNSITNGSAVPDNWQLITPHMYQNTETKELIEVSTVVLPKGLALSDYSDWYEARLSPSTKFVRVIDYKPKGSVCCNSKKEVVVFTERIYNIDQLELSPEEVNFVFHESLVAFRHLFREFGLFLITKGMIGINQKGIPKVWINQNYAKNHFDEDEDDKLTEEAVVNSLVQLIDQKTNSNRLETAFRNYSSRRTLDNAFSFIQRLQNNQPFAIHQVFLNRTAFEAFRARSTIASKQTMDFSFAAKAQKLQMSSHSRMDQSKPVGSITSSVHSGARESHKFVNSPPLHAQRQSLQITSSSHSSISQNAPTHPQPLQQSPLTNLPHLHNGISNQTQPKFHKVVRTSAEEAQLQRSSTGMPAQRLSAPCQPVYQARMSGELKSDSKRQTTKINLISPPPVNKPKAAPPKPPKAQIASPAIRTSQQAQKNTVATINTANTINSFVSRTSRENSGLLQHQLSRVGQSNALDFTLNRVSTPMLPDSTTDLDRDNCKMKKSDSERLLEYRQAEMYRSIPKVDSVVVISRSDNNHDIIDISNPPENYRISLIESTIERGLDSNQ